MKRINQTYILCGVACLLFAAGQPAVQATVAGADQPAETLTVASERGFTIPPNVQTPIVLKTTRDAVCDLHTADDSDSRFMRLYANAEGYVKVNANLEESQESRVVLDCTSPNGSARRYPLHLVAGFYPTSELPVPRGEVPIPKRSRVQPALTEAEAQYLSDDELTSRGYPPRPDSPDACSSWLQVVTRASIQVDAHTVSQSDISRHTVEAGVTDSSNWSGYVADAKTNRSYASIHGEWNMPEVVTCENDSTTYSAFWIGLDGYYLSELSQEGTEQDCYYIGGSYYTNYFAWSEVLPQQPTEQKITGFTPNWGDYIYATLWIGTSTGKRTNNGSGGYIWIFVNDMTQGVYTQYSVKLASTTYFYGKTVEWIMERPIPPTGGLAELTDYGSATMANAQAITSKGNSKDYSVLPNLVQLWLYNEFFNGPDNNKLSTASDASASTISFKWYNWH